MILTNKQKMYLAFLESLKRPNNKALVECVQKAFILSECGNGRSCECENGECHCANDGAPVDESRDPVMKDDYLDDEGRPYNFQDRKSRYNRDDQWYDSKRDGVDGYFADEPNAEEYVDDVVDQVLREQGY